MRRILLVCLVSAIFQACGAGSVACRRMSQGDLPCQVLKGEEFDRCQQDLQDARTACQAEQMAARKDSSGFYNLPH